MGFFSQACAATDICGGKDILSDYAAPPEFRWMTDAVVITPNGSLIKGNYDGYGTVDGHIDAIGMSGNAVWHRACWELSDSPTDFDPDMVRDGDTNADGFSVQGFFFTDDYLIPDPRKQVAPTR